MTKALKLVEDQEGYPTRLFEMRSPENPAAVVELPPLGSAAPQPRRPRRRREWTAVAGGSLGLLWSGFFIFVDAWNNHEGASAELGALAGLLGVAAAAGLFVVPMLAAKGWTPETKSAYRICLIFSAVCAVLAWLHAFNEREALARAANGKISTAAGNAAQGKADRERQVAERANLIAQASKAEEDRSAAQAKLAIITVADTVANLQAEAKKADRANSRCPNYNACKDTKNALATAQENLRSAQQRDSLQIVRDEAKERKENLERRADELQKQIGNLSDRIETASDKADEAEIVDRAIPRLLASFLQPLTGVEVKTWTHLYNAALAFLLITLSLRCAKVVPESVRNITIGWDGTDIEQDVDIEPRAPKSKAKVERIVAAASASPAIAQARQEAEVAVITDEEKLAATVKALFKHGKTWRRSSDLQQRATDHLQKLFPGKRVEYSHVSFPKHMERAGFKGSKNRAKQAGWWVDIQD